MSELDRFMKALDGPWVVERLESHPEGVKVFYRSLDDRGVLWSHVVTNKKPADLFPIGTVVRCGMAKV